MQIECRSCHEVKSKDLFPKHRRVCRICRSTYVKKSEVKTSNHTDNDYKQNKPTIEIKAKPIIVNKENDAKSVQNESDYETESENYYRTETDNEYGDKPKHIPLNAPYQRRINTKQLCVTLAGFSALIDCGYCFLTAQGIYHTTVNNVIQSIFKT